MVEYVGVSEVREERPPIGSLIPLQFKPDLHMTSQKGAPIPMHEGRVAVRTVTRLRVIIRLQKPCSLDLGIMGHFKVRVPDVLESQYSVQIETPTLSPKST